MNVAILSAHTGWHTDELCRALTERRHQAHVVPYEGLRARLGAADGPGSLSSEGTSILDADAVLARIIPNGSLEQVIYRVDALHWIEDHAPVFVALFNSLAPGGIFAVQIPRNFGAPSHTSMGEAARMGPWRPILEPLLRPAPVAEPAFYYNLLAPLADKLDMWETEYLQVLDGDHAVKEYMSV